MAYRRKSYRKRPYRKSRRGKSSRSMNRKSFAAKVKKVMMKNVETKYFDKALEDHELYHNLGSNIGGLVPLTVTSIPQFFNPWAFIAKGTERYQRIGDKITPRGMSLKLYLANKDDRPNTMIRLIVAVLPKSIQAAVVTAQFDPFQTQNVGANGNNMINPCDSNVGCKFLYDKIHRLGTQTQYAFNAGKKEQTKIVRLFIKRKRPSDIVYSDNVLDIVNKPLAIYAIPYEQYSTLTTDNVSSLAGYMRLYYKDA